MPELTPLELELLRSGPPVVEWYLAVAPYGDPCFTAQVNNAAITRGARTIDYDNDVGEAAVARGITLWVGTVPGGRDVGTVRLRSINAIADQITIAENDDIDWQDDLHLTCPGVGGFYELWSKYQRITEAGFVVTFFKDYDVTYTNEGNHLPPKANAGPPVIAWIDPSTGHVDVPFIGEDSAATEAAGVPLTRWTWIFPGGNPNFLFNVQGTRDSPISVRWNTPGFRYVLLDVADTLASIGDVVIPTWIFQEGVEEPYSQVEVQSQLSSVSEGPKCVFKVFDVDEDKIYDFTDGALVVLFTKTWYGGILADVGKYLGPADTDQGALACVLNGIQDTGQDFSDWQTAVGNSTFLIIVTNNDGTECWGYCRDSFNTGGADDSIRVSQDIAGVMLGWASGACANPDSYRIWEVNTTPPTLGRGNVRFVGWLEGETLTFDHADGIVEFSAVSHDEVMRRLPGFGFTLEDNAAPTDWYEMNDLNVDRALHHLLEYQSTVNRVCHVELPGEGGNRVIAIQPFADTNLYQQAQEELLKDAMCLLLTDRQGIVRAVRDPQMMSAAERNMVPVVCHLLSNNPNAQADWMNELEEARAHVFAKGLVRLGGFHYETPLLSRAPGEAPSQQEDEMPVEGCILTGQAEANLWSGRKLALANNPYPAVPLDFRGYWPVIDPAYGEWIRLTVTDPIGRNPAWVSERFLVREMEFMDFTEEGTALTRAVLEKETEPIDGQTETIPDTPPPDPPPAPPAPPDLPVPYWDGPLKRVVAHNSRQIGMAVDILDHFVLSDATVGTGVGVGLDLYDADIDFVARGVIGGDYVENITDGGRTTVASVAPGGNRHRVILTADINLDPTDVYCITGHAWADISGLIDTTLLGANEQIIQFEWVRLTETTVGAWVLTQVETAGNITGGNVWRTTNIQTTTPVWTTMLTLAAVRTATGQPDAEFRGMKKNASDPNYLIVSFSEVPVARAGPGVGTVYTANFGAGWNYSTYPQGGCPSEPPGDCRYTVLCPYYALDIDDYSGIIYHLRGGNGFDGLRLFLYFSADGGGTFQVAAAWPVYLAGAVWDTWRMDVYRPMDSGRLFAEVREPQIAFPTAACFRSNDDGISWNDLTPAGYIIVDSGAVDGGKTGCTGWYPDINDIITVMERIADNEHVIMRSRDGGTTWTEMGDAGNDEAAATGLFQWMPGLFTGAVCAAPITWDPDEEVLLCAGMAQSNILIAQVSRRLVIRMEVEGVGTWAWCDMTRQWYDNPAFDWDGDTSPEWVGGRNSSSAPGYCMMYGLPRIGIDE